ncbi:MAG TPA: zinc-dependent metalloprotease, partial [Lacipirellulaceae bacterium]|nr:zinc-dependent metalloprotease [Lacipirellulaceae bacterium]
MTLFAAMLRISRRPARALLSAAMLAAALAPALASAQEPAKKPSKFKEFSEVTKEAKKIEGLFDLYHKDQHLYANLTAGDMGRPFLAPMSVARGAGSAGMALNFDEQWVIAFQRVGDYVHLIRKNLRYEAPKGTPLEKAVQQNYTDSVLMALPIVSENAPGGGVLIDLADIFFTDFADLSVGGLDRSRASWHKIKAYPENLELQVNVTFNSNPMGMGSDGDYGYIDPRGVTLVMHYSIVQMPDAGYRPRLADQRVGYFLNATKDFGTEDPDTTFVRRINRWRLEKADPSAELSVPKKQIVWWVEDTVPHEYRPYVEEGILEWNKAFEKIGFRNALSVRWQNDRDEFDPEDINYCTFRWVTTPVTFAMSNVRSNPITGEMIDGDVIFDASWIRFWQQEHAYLVGASTDDGDDDDDEDDKATLLGTGEILSPMMASQYGYGMPMSVRGRLGGASTHAALRGERTLAAIPGNWSSFHTALSRKASNTGCCAACQYTASMQGQFRMAAISLAARGSGIELPEEMLGQVIKSVVMHEVGHSLGLRHNFRASTMLSLKDLHDTSITRKKGLVGSVMDYTPVNIARKGETQGDYATTTLGPYDYWAIEYAYKPISGDEKEELKKIASRSPQEGYEYATDEDLYDSYDPRVNLYDLGSDSLEFAKHRIALAGDVLEDMDDKLVKDGESWARLRPAFVTIMQQYGDAAYLAMRYVGGRHVSRDARGKDAKDPVVPVAGDEQRKALKFVAEHILVDNPVPMRPELLRRVTSEHWMHWGSDSSISESRIAVPYYEYVQAIQNIAMSEAFGSSARLGMIESNEALADEDSKPLRAAEVFRTFTDAVWSDLKGVAKQAAAKAENDAKAEAGDEAEEDADDDDSSNDSDDDEADDDSNDDEDEAVKLAITKVRRNMQRTYLQYLITIALGPKYDSGSLAYALFASASSPYPADARSLARQHLKEIHGLIRETLANDDVQVDELSR